MMHCIPCVAKNDPFYVLNVCDKSNKLYHFWYTTLEKLTLKSRKFAHLSFKLLPNYLGNASVCEGECKFI